MRRKLSALLLATALGLGLSGCASAVSSDTGGAPELDTESGDISFELYERSIKLSDGRVITCIIYDAERYEQGGLSCDWNPDQENAYE